jgi:hypothetical protein
MCLSTTVFSPAVRPTQLPVQCLSQGAKRSRCETDNLPPSSVEDKKDGALPPLISEARRQLYLVILSPPWVSSVLLMCALSYCRFRVHVCNVTAWDCISLAARHNFRCVQCQGKNPPPPHTHTHICTGHRFRRIARQLTTRFQDTVN